MVTAADADGGDCGCDDDDCYSDEIWDLRESRYGHTIYYPDNDHRVDTKTKNVKCHQLQKKM